MKKKTAFLILGAVIVSLLLATVVTYVAGDYEDGLEHVAKNLGFDKAEKKDPSGIKVMPDYELEGLRSPFWRKVLPGIIGVLAAGLIAWLVAILLKGRRKKPKA